MKRKYTTETSFELVRKNQLAELKFGLVRENKCVGGEE